MRSTRHLKDSSEAVRDGIRKCNQPDKDLSHLRRAWQEAVADNSEGLDPEPVFARLENKLNRLI
jgi:Arc/MetJ-type ribon-helix-helix transcriptional regulator